MFIVVGVRLVGVHRRRRAEVSGGVPWSSCCGQWGRAVVVVI